MKVGRLPEKLSIVHVVRSPVGGIFRHIADLASAQNEAGHAVGVICDSLTGGAFEDEWIAAVAPKLELGISRLPMPRSIGPADLAATFRVARRIARMRPDRSEERRVGKKCRGSWEKHLFNRTT